MHDARIVIVRATLKVHVTKSQCQREDEDNVSLGRINTN